MAFVNKKRYEHVNGESVVGQFLDKYFYSKCEDFERVADVSRQVKGIDVIFTMNGKQYLTDEKAAVSYVNKDLKTYSMELGTLNQRGEYITGWLLDDDKINDSYLFIWIPNAKADRLTSPSDILKMETALVSKERIKQYLDGHGFTKSVMEEEIERLKSGYPTKFSNMNRNGFKVVHSTHLFEQPINVIIPKEELKKMADVCKTFVRK